MNAHRNHLFCQCDELTWNNNNNQHWVDKIPGMIVIFGARQKEIGVAYKKKGPFGIT
jgi:hypothetical protein